MNKKRYEFCYQDIKFEIEAWDWEDVKDKILDCISPVEEVGQND